MTDPKDLALRSNGAAFGIRTAVLSMSCVDPRRTVDDGQRE